MTTNMTKSSMKLTDTLTLTTANDGVWLYDYTRGMNLAMRAKSEIDALVEALTYYQSKLSKTEAELSSLSNKVGLFISQFSEDEYSLKEKAEEGF